MCGSTSAFVFLQPILRVQIACASSRVYGNVTSVCFAALITLFTPFEYLSDATSISTLFSFFLVAASLLWRRYVHHLRPFNQPRT